MKELERIYLFHTLLTGSVPSGMCSLDTLNSISVDCYPQNVLVSCDCGTKCNCDVAPSTVGPGSTGSTSFVSRKSDSFEDGSPGAKAFHWIADHDSLNLSANNPSVKQRYILALMFYSMNGEDWQYTWIETNGIGGNDKPECVWDGVQCDKSNNVIKIDLATIGLAGSIPSEIAELSHLTYLDLSSNGFVEGRIPDEFKNLHALDHLFLDNTNLSGEVPSALCRMNIEVLLVDCYQPDPKISCECDACQCDGSDTKPFVNTPRPPTESPTLPPTHFKNPQKHSIKEVIGGNPRPGTPEYDALHWLIHTDKQGLGPNSPRLIQRYVLAVLFYSVRNLPDDWLQPDANECLFLGVLCSDDGVVTKITMVDDELVGSLPTDLGRLSNVTFLNFNKNKLFGGVPTELGLLTNLGELRIVRGKKRLTNFPPEYLVLYNNDLSGTVPPEICKLTSQGALVGVEVDCDGTKPEISCDCCGNCP
eukprot:CAMPEP_0118680296 /NCGR_PEP_ID=MMETSP0800-20121206/4279_1 /TAXON_ID=210618 ORGANISM="Striatella unipunctata, Strain CCMP2910" /NCGR_SAMPLE_ID=MMETSP0800 /ASSEMBLY_ACC=CAM_ASM_000638 /LENGTH=475 /DNA_ID=CAMNT_0006576415 /DNA_START=102 /DNA_END=1530 /DNA_ORIENTATION=+